MIARLSHDKNVAIRGKLLYLLVNCQELDWYFILIDYLEVG